MSDDSNKYLSVCVRVYVGVAVCVCVGKGYTDARPHSFTHSAHVKHLKQQTDVYEFVQIHMHTHVHKLSHMNTNAGTTRHTVRRTHTMPHRWIHMSFACVCVCVCAREYFGCLVRKLKLLNHTHISSDSSICFPLFRATWDFISLSFQNCSPFFSLSLYPFAHSLILHA